MTTSAAVTLDVFSGRPNPTWYLSESDTKELRKRVESLQSIAAGPVNPDVLGYRATRVEVRTGADVVVQLVFSRGIVTEVRNGAQKYYADSGRQIELWLVKTGAGHIDGSLVEHVVGEISSKP